MSPGCVLLVWVLLGFFARALGMCTSEQCDEAFCRIDDCKCEDSGYGWFAVSKTPSSFVCLRGCAVGQNVCPVRTSCLLFHGIGYVCLCATGFHTTKAFECADDDECSHDPSFCSINETCVNTVGSYTCVAKTPLLTTVSPSTTSRPTTVTATTTRKVPPPPTPRRTPRRTQPITVPPTVTPRPALQPIISTRVPPPVTSLPTLQPITSKSAATPWTSESTIQPVISTRVSPDTSEPRITHITSAEADERLHTQAARETTDHNGQPGAVLMEKSLLIGLSCAVVLLVLTVLILIAICRFKTRNNPHKASSSHQDANAEVPTTTAGEAAKDRDSMPLATVTINNIYSPTGPVLPRPHGIDDSDARELRFSKGMSTSSWGSDAFSVDFSLDGDENAAIDDDADERMYSNGLNPLRKGRLPATPNEYCDMTKSVRKVNYSIGQSDEYTQGIRLPPPPYDSTPGVNHYANVAL